MFESPGPPSPDPSLRAWLGGASARVRVRFSPAAAVGLIAVAAIAVALSTVLLLRGRPHEVTVGPPALTSAAPSASPSAEVTVVVDVAGPVRHPGVVRLPAGSRVVDAIAAAGGLRPGAETGAVNLAAVLTDGQQVVLGSAVAAPPASGSAGPGAAGGGAPIDLNSATLEQLDTLPGVGPVLAQRILDWRSAHGRFTRVDQLGDVGGIGSRRLAELSPRVRI